MAMEKRGNNFYYYRKKRVSGKVVSVYCGKGEQGRMLYEQDLRNRQYRLEERRRLMQKINQDQKLIADLRKLEKNVSTITQAMLLINGYTQHKGQWRKKRNGQEEKE